jgi:RecB family exonuclease
MTTAIFDYPLAAAEPVTGRDYISFTSLRQFQTCPARYYFKYILGLPEESVSAALVYGGGVHRAIERHFRELLIGNPPPDSRALLEEFWADWNERNPEQIRFGKDEDAESLGRLAERTLIAFRQSDAARPQGKILAVEEELRGPVIPGCPDLLGRIDLIVDAGNMLTISDWKTSRSRWSREQAEDASEQLLLYSELAKDFAPGKPIQVEFVILTKTKEVAVDRHTLPVDPARVARTKRIAKNVWRAIEAGNFYPAPSAMNCPSCPYRETCRDWGGEGGMV